MKYAVAVVDDDRMLAEALRAWADDRDDMRVVATAGSVSELLDATAHADVTLLDLRLPDRTDPVANVRRLRAADHQVLIVSGWAEPGQVAATFAAGARGYMTKDQSLPTLANAIHEVATGGTVYSPELAAALLDAPRRPRLSERERLVLVAYASGMTLKSVARSIGIRPETAKTYLERIKVKYRELGRPAQTKIELADRVREDGIATSP